MSEKHENIEDFVRKVVDQSEAQIPFNESHWQQMESMLEAELPVVSNPGTGYYYFSNVVSLLVGAVFVWLWFTGERIDEPQIIAGQNSEIVQAPKESAISESSTSAVGSTPEISDEAQPSVSVVSETAEVAKDNQSVNRTPESAVSSLTSSTTNDSPAAQVATKEIENNTENSATRSVQPQTSETIVSNASSTSRSDSAAEGVDNTDVATAQAERVPPPTTLSEHESSVSSAGDDRVVLVNEDEAVVPENYFDTPSSIGIDLSGDLPPFPKDVAKVEVYEPDGGSYEQTESPIVNGSTRGPFSRLSLSISLAPDLSSNEIFRYNRLGRDLGIVVDYWFTPRLSVSVGAFNTSKRYLVGGEEYNPPAGFWGNVTNGELPAKIDAKCQVLDIPINLKYQLISRPKINIAASAGVSSYIMLKEDYQYELDNGWQSEWGTRNENQHFFGVGNLQVHIERRFGKHFAVEVAPFFKVPLTSYGHGNIRFHSMGSFFTLRKYFLTR